MSDRTWSSYGSAESFRDALEDRLRHEARSTGVPLDRLRKEAAFHRLLARFAQMGGGSWALKGGFALMARLGPGTRGTKDVDANWRYGQEDLEELIDRVEGVDLGDWFTFEFSDAKHLQGEKPDSMALRYSVDCRLGPRIFEQIKLDVNLIGADDPRPTEDAVIRRNPFSFVGSDDLVVPMLPPAHQLAEKLHAYLRTYTDGTSSRPKDLFDSIVVATQVELPPLRDVAAAAAETFHLRETAWPPEQIPAPPRDWASEWGALVEGSDDAAVTSLDLQQAGEVFRRFWVPAAESSADGAAMWDASSSAWTTE